MSLQIVHFALKSTFRKRLKTNLSNAGIVIIMLDQPMMQKVDLVLNMMDDIIYSP